MKISAIWRDWRGTLGFLLGMLVFRSAVADWNYIPSSSMNPTLVAGDRVVVNKMAYSVRVPFTLWHLARWSSPRRGEVVTFDSPEAEEVNLIKRVVAVAGDEVAMQNNQLIVNGSPVQRDWQGPLEVLTEGGSLQLQVWREHLPSADGVVSYTVGQWPAHNVYPSFPAVRVPTDHVLVLGDSRDNSNDSRFIGMIPVGRVTGRAERVALSHDPQRLYAPRGDRWWLPLSN